MSKFVVLTNVNAPFEGKEIVINTDHIVSVYRDILAGNKLLYGQAKTFGTLKKTLIRLWKK